MFAQCLQTMMYRVHVPFRHDYSRTRTNDTSGLMHDYVQQVLYK